MAQLHLGSARALCAASLFLALATAGCDDASDPGSDAGSALDAGERSDAGSTPDGGAPTDAGSTADAGFAADAGPRTFLPVYPIDARYTEGGIYDSVSHRFFVGSLDNGSVNAIDATTGAESLIFEETAPGLWWTLGMDIDEARSRLYVCAMEDRRGTSADPPYDGYVWVFDTNTGERIANHDLADVNIDATCTDTVVADDGTVYIADRENPRIYALSTDGTLSLLVQDNELSGAVVGQNALLVLPDQSALLSLVYLPSRLVHVRLSDGAVTRVDIDGDFSDGLPPLSGADGMAWDGDTVLVAFTSQLNRVTPILADWSRASASTVDVPSGMTDVVSTPAGAYLLNGQAVGFALGSDPDPFELVRFDGVLP